MKYLYIVFLIFTLSSCSIFEKNIDDPMCTQIADFANKVKESDSKSVTLTLDSYFEKSCKSEVDGTGKNLCTWLLKNTSREFQSINVSRAFQCLNGKPIQLSKYNLYYYSGSGKISSDKPYKVKDGTVVEIDYSYGINGIKPYLTIKATAYGKDA